MTQAQMFDHLPLIFGGLFLAILFVQSGIDKVTDWSGNIDWLSGHFAKSFLSGMVAPLLIVLTVMELATGIASTIGVIHFLVSGTATVLFYASIVGAATLTALFFGQRVAKDYPGAAVIVPYFILDLTVIYLSAPVR